jgi:hypothetical protein
MMQNGLPHSTHVVCNNLQSSMVNVFYCTSDVINCPELCWGNVTVYCSFSNCQFKSGRP